MNPIQLTINGQRVTGQEGQTILEIAAASGIHIPTLCHDGRVAPAGACGVCVVEAEKSPRLLRACSTKAADGMVIGTDTPRVREARDSALALMLSDHTGDCRPPCALACPAQTDCQGYVGLIANGAYKEALSLIREKLPLPGCIGRVCPAPCEKACRREMVEEPISIAHLKTFAVNTANAMGANPLPTPKSDTGKHVAIVGGGPGGLTAAYFLRLSGHSVTIYDAMPKMGGMLRYGIPDFRLPQAVLDDEIAQIECIGVTMKNEIKLGTDITLDELRSKHDAVLIAIGAWSSMPLNCPGDKLEGVLEGIHFLREVALNQFPRLAGSHVLVIGGGNTAMDTCRTAVRLGASTVTNIYRRTKSEMPAEPIEIKEAEEEGVSFKFLSSPLEIEGENGQATGIRLQKMQLGEPDASGRRSPVPIAGQEETLPADLVLLAIGQSTNPAGLSDISLTKWGSILADENTFATNLPGVFAVGDATNKGAGIAVEAIGEARKAATVIDGYLTTGEITAFEKPFTVTREDVDASEFADTPKAARQAMPHVSPQIRNQVFEQVNLGYSEEQAKAEAKRCLECGCKDYFNCKLVNYANMYKVQPVYSGEKTTAVTDASHPFIIRNPEKCILCGLCIRVCDQVMDVGALDFDGRGFDTMVKPAFDQPLAETDCQSCGQCAAICPTGALTEQLPLAKSVPLAETLTKSTCVQCGMGCDVTYASHGSLLLRALPADTGLLCQKGRFESLNIFRITDPLVRNQKVAAEEAVAFIHEKISDFTPESIAVAISGTCTNEVIDRILSFTKTTLKTDNIYATKGIGESLPKTTSVLTKQKDLLPEGNSQGLANANVNMETGALQNAIKSGKIKALFVFGDTVPAEWRSNLEFLVLATATMPDTAADVVLPFPAPFETTGTITLADGTYKYLQAAVPPNCEIVMI